MNNLLGIVGASCSGKSTVAVIVSKNLSAKLFHLDKFWVKGSFKPVINGELSYERPEQYDGAALAQEIKDYLENYSQRLAVVEGFLLFCYPEIVDLCGTKVFLDVPYDLLVKRRIARAKSGINPAGFHIGGSYDNAAEKSWLANGRDEWNAYGAGQADIEGVVLVDPVKPPELVAEEITNIWTGALEKTLGP